MQHQRPLQPNSLPRGIQVPRSSLNKHTSDALTSPKVTSTAHSQAQSKSSLGTKTQRSESQLPGLRLRFLDYCYPPLPPYPPSRSRKTEAHQKKVSIHRKNFGSFCYSTVWEREWTMAHQRLCERNDKNKVFIWAQFPWTLFWENKRAKSVWSGTTQT